MIKQQLISQSKYNVKCPYAMNPVGICVHNTANDASAQNEVTYMISNNNEVSFHIAIDDTEAIQAIPFNRNAWAAGDGGEGNGNRKYIHIEICYSKSGGDKFIAAEQRAAKEIAALLKQFGWTIANVKKHQDFSNKYCPHRTLDMGWQRFLNMILAELNPVSTQKEMYRIRKTWDDAKSQIGAYSNLDNAIAECKKYLGYSVYNSAGIEVFSNKPVESGEYITNEYAESGVFTCTVDSIYFRSNPKISNENPVQGQYFRGEKVVYDYVVITNKYVYISWIGVSGARRYMPVRDLVNKEVWGTFA